MASDNVAYTEGSGKEITARAVTYSGDAAYAQVVGVATFAGSDDAKTITDVPAGHGTAAAALRVELPTDGTGMVDVVNTITNVVHVDDNAGSLTVDGSVTVTQGTATSLKAQAEVYQGGTAVGSGNPLQVTVANTGANSTAIKVDGTGGTFPVSGTVTANIGTSGSLALDATVAALEVAQGSTTSGQSGPLVQGAVTTAAPTYTTAKTNALSLTTGGALRSDLTTIAGTAPTTAGKVDVKGADGDVFVRQGTASNLKVEAAIASAQTLATVTTVGTITNVVHVDDNSGSLTVDNGGTFAVQATLAAETTKVIGTARILGNGGATLDATVGAGTAPANMVAVGGLYNSTEIGPTTGQSAALQLDAKGRLRGVLMDAAGNTRGANVDSSNRLSVTLDNIAAAQTLATVTTVGTITNVVHVDDNSGSLTVDGTVTANIGTSGSLALDATVSALEVAQGSTTSGQNGALVQGAVTTAAPTYTTAKTNPLSLTTAGGLRTDLATIAGTAPTTAGKVDVKGADGDVFVRQATAANLNATVVGTGTFATQATLSAETTKVIGTVNVAAGQTIATTNAGTFAVQNNGTGKTHKVKTGSASATFTIVAAVTSKKIKVYGLSLMTASTTAVTVTFKDAASGTAIATYILQAITGTNFGIVENVPIPSQLFETSAGNLLEMAFSAAQSVTYNLRYFDDDAT